MQYPIAKPTYPITIKILAAAVILGLLGLGLVAFEVFSMIDNPIVAAAFALVIELGAISESLALIRRNKPAVVGLFISLAVSGIYNYTRAAAAAANLAVTLSPVELVALALGPLSATLFLALALGHELAAFEQKGRAWEQGLKAWSLAQQAEKEQAESRRLEREQARTLELRTLELASQERIERAKIRAEGRSQHRTSMEVLPGSMEVLPSKVEVARGSYSNFVEVLRRNGREWKNVELAQELGVSTRTITEWRKKLAAETETAPLINTN